MLLFSYQCPYRIVSFSRTILFVVCHFLADSLLIVSHLFFFVKNFFKIFSNHFFVILCCFSTTNDMLSHFSLLVNNFFHLCFRFVFSLICFRRQRVIYYHWIFVLSTLFLKKLKISTIHSFLYFICHFPLLFSSVTNLSC